MLWAWKIALSLINVLLRGNNGKSLSTAVLAIPRDTFPDLNAATCKITLRRTAPDKEDSTATIVGQALPRIAEVLHRFTTMHTGLQLMLSVPMGIAVYSATIPSAMRTMKSLSIEHGVGPFRPSTPLLHAMISLKM